jgi:hypothetical protein
MRGKKLVSGGARSSRRAADQPHRAAHSHTRTVRIGRERLVEATAAETTSAAAGPPASVGKSVNSPVPEFLYFAGCV